ncbi:hypothetical protein HG536_0C06130 [Torulaspora globosa]|uniref:C2H2-type domain-containing protein n=1 Tax=Torulaspora globosa TaxID=48254 RepID=A0A7G3ZG08_9SACH|nr:uncharacterized protein HG536_0C06130 [Torulaspora globosa]QLL32444.1 hypothetical protein HG536_0C06130 [Torulaspora globosa]
MVFSESEGQHLSPAYQATDSPNLNIETATLAVNQPEKAGLLPIPKKSLTIKTDKPRPHLCPICTRGFVRQEHLKRHQRSHTNERPFLCVFCGRCFARRDLVLRHQHKLHGSLVGSNPLSNISSSSSLADMTESDSVANSDPDKHIIKVVGNKESILPTPSNPLARTAAQLKKDAREAAAMAKMGSSASPIAYALAVPASSSSSSSLNSVGTDLSMSSDGKSQSVLLNLDRKIEANKPKRRKRHASFSASSAFTYVNTNESSEQMIKALESIKDVPHQVGFSTPQLTAQQLMDKAIESGVTDAELLNMPSEFYLDDFMPPEYHNDHDQKRKQDYFSLQPSIGGGKNGDGRKLNASFEQPPSLPMTPGAYLLHGTPSLTNFLTMGSTMGGAGGFAAISSSDSNLTSFKYQPFEQHSTFFEASPSEKSKNNTIGGQLQPSSSTNGLVDRPNSLEIQSHRTNHENAGEDQWFKELIHGPLQEPNFKLDFDHLNDIGFVDAFSNSSSSATPLLRENSAVNSFSPGFGHSPMSPNPTSALESGQLEYKSDESQGRSNLPRPSFGHKGSFSLGPTVSSMFTSRQRDLFKKSAESSGSYTSPSPRVSSSSESPLNDASRHRRGSKLKLFDEEFRNAIILEAKMRSELFPSLDELNNYVNLYQYEFHRYFPFIHLHTLVPSMTNYPIVLSMTMIGALYAFHSSHAMLLSNICWQRVKELLHELRSNHLTTPLWLIQSMILLTFFGIFSNDLDVTKGMSNKIMILIDLVKSTKLNMPLESLQTPPIESDHILEFQDNPEVLKRIRAEYNTPQQIRRNFDYFILAQARIRTCHTILLISNLFSSLVGLECMFHSIDLKCGVPCFHEVLFACEDATEWVNNLRKFRLVLDSKFSLIQLSNGEDYEHCLMYLSTGSPFYYENSKISFRTLLSMLISVHEKIFLERSTMRYETNEQMNEIKWRMTSRPIIDSMLKYWESIFLKSGGILACKEETIPYINANPVMRLIIPLHLFANIRKCLDLRYVINRIWLKDWEAMNRGLDNLCPDKDSLREASNYALGIIHFWVETVSVMRNAERTAIRTPISSITCILSSILIVSEHMRRVESWALKFDASDPQAPIINASDRITWLKSEKVLKKVEQHLLPKGYNSQSYAEFLRLQAKGALDVDVLDNDLAQQAMRPDTAIAETQEVIKKARLSSRSLYLGVRMLGDAPIWPIALLFAHALQARAIYNLKTNPVSLPTGSTKMPQ